MDFGSNCLAVQRVPAECGLEARRLQGCTVLTRSVRSELATIITVMTETAA